MSSANEMAERLQYLAFTLAGGDYAISILKVKEILQYEGTTKVPSTPRSIRGVINLRGGIVPVVDLAVKFGLPEAAVTSRTCVLVVETLFDGAAAVMGLLADAVSEVVDLGADDVEPMPSFGTHVKVDYLLGVGKVGKRFVLLLDIDRVLSADEQEMAAMLERGDVAALESDDLPAGGGAETTATCAVPEPIEQASTT